MKVFSCTKKQEKGELAMEITRGYKLVIENQQHFPFMSSPTTPDANSCPSINQSVLRPHKLPLLLVILAAQRVSTGISQKDPYL